jgi:heme-degrading monooxygenase HmoA
MISRIWHGYTTFENADSYEKLLKEEIFTGIKERKLKGYKGIQLLRRNTDQETEFITIMWFESLESVKEFAGSDYENAVVPEKAQKILTRFDNRSQHYEVADVNKLQGLRPAQIGQSDRKTIQKVIDEFRTETLPILLAAVWIGVSEFFRNQFLLKSLWVNHYDNLGLTFPSDPVTGAVWGIWSLMLSVAIFYLSKKFTLWQTTFLSWFTAIAMMWLVLGNLNVLPHRLMLYSLPFSILETFVATWIVKRFQHHSKTVISINTN